MKIRKPSNSEIIKATKDFNSQSVFVEIPIFKKIKDIERYAGFPGFNLREKNLKSFRFDRLLFSKIFCLEDKISALNYHLLNIRTLKSKHKKALGKFASMLGNNSTEVRITHSANRLRYEFEAFQFQFKACLDLLAYIVYNLYNDLRTKNSPFKSLKNELKNSLKNKYLATEIYKILDNEWINEFLSDDIRKSKRDKSAHYPWELSYIPSEIIYNKTNLRYISMKEEDGDELYNYCSTYFVKLENMVSKILGLFFM